MAEKLKKILKNYLQGTNFKEINDTITLEKIWKETVGNPINKNTEIISFKNKILTIKASSPVWRNELCLQKKIILEKIKKNTTQTKINEIKLI